MMRGASRNEVIDGVRGIAAGYVALSHIVLEQLGSAGSRWGWLFSVGQEAVVAFFLISGFVIVRSEEQRGNFNAADFLWRRAVRLFPVLGLAFGLAYAHACVVAGRWVDPHWVELLGNCFFLQDFVPVKPGAWVNPYWGNAALWSLSYEWWFYVGYAALRSRVPERNRLTWVASISLAGLAVLAWRPIAPAYWSAYFIIWWAGATWGQREGENGLVWRQRWWTLACLGFATLCAAGLVGRWSGALRPGTFPVLILRHFAAALVLVVLAFATRRMNPASLSRWVRIGLPIAPFSYALYVMHTPVAAQEPWISGFSGWGAALVMGAVAVSVSWWAETIYHPWAARGLNRARAWFGGDQG